MKIIIQRDSISTNDDLLAPHEMIFQVPDTMTYSQLHEFLIQEHYYPSTEGNNAVWVLSSQKYWDIYSYFTKTGEIDPNQVEKFLIHLCPEGDFYLNYYSSPIEWQKKILNYFHGNQRIIYLEGWMKEYLYCNELMKDDLPAYSIFDVPVDI